MKSFLRGQRHQLADFAPLHTVWQVEVALDAPQFVTDFCCLGLDASGQPLDDSYLIYYNRPDAPYGAIAMDNMSNDGAVFTIDLERLPPEVRRLAFTVTLQKGDDAGAVNISGGGALADIFNAAFGEVGLAPSIGDGFIALRAGTLDVGFFPFSSRDFRGQSTLVLGEIYWKDGWRFVGVGQGLAGDLAAFLGHLGDGSVAAPTQPVAIPAAKVLAAQTSIAPTPAPSVPPTPPRIAAPVATIPVETTKIEAPKPALAASVAKPDISALPQSLPPGGKLQDLIDAAPPRSTLTLLRGEYEGPLVINKPLVLAGQDSAIWARQGPVVTVLAPDVSLRDLEIEVTTPQNASGEGDIALKIVGPTPQLLDVRLSGRTSGLSDAGGEWKVPPALDLGVFAARTDNGWTWELSVPTAVHLASSVEGLSLSPENIEAGTHQITLTLRDVAPDALIAGQIEVRGNSLTRTIAVSGSAAHGAAAARGTELWSVPNPA